ncbi:MAG TPA: hypothetical protein VF121_19110 [Thermoanaerobaculia bacterium]|nr:hypothetical protein [Thermoanaerobaculia bacterium]
MEREVAAQHLPARDAAPQLLQMVEVAAELDQALDDPAHRASASSSSVRMRRPQPLRQLAVGNPFRVVARHRASIARGRGPPAARGTLAPPSR